VRYEVFLEREVHQARERLPGNFRQRIRAAITGLALEPRPAPSQILDTSSVEVPIGVELRRLRLDPWRLVYAIHEQEKWVWVLALRRRPPYDYEDLADLLSRFKQ
jgi:mRNA-degrading endonuclease RelE of RelBE toxin-antitoxin system